jgi:hypothetical protein
MVVGGVSSPKRGRNGGGSNSDGDSGAPIARCKHEDKGERGGVLARSVKEKNGGGGAAMGSVLYNDTVEGRGGGQLVERGRAA